MTNDNTALCRAFLLAHHHQSARESAVESGDLDQIARKGGAE